MIAEAENVALIEYIFRYVSLHLSLPPSLALARVLTRSLALCLSRFTEDDVRYYNATNYLTLLRVDGDWYFKVRLASLFSRIRVTSLVTPIKRTVAPPSQIRCREPNYLPTDFAECDRLTPRPA